MHDGGLLPPPRLQLRVPPGDGAEATRTARLLSVRLYNTVSSHWGECMDAREQHAASHRVVHAAWPRTWRRRTFYRGGCNRWRARGNMAVRVGRRRRWRARPRGVRPRRAGVVCHCGVESWIYHTRSRQCGHRRAAPRCARAARESQVTNGRGRELRAEKQHFYDS